MSKNDSDVFLDLENHEDLKKDFLISLTPKWFKFIEWLTLIGILTYAYQRTQHPLIGVLLVISLILVLWYFEVTLIFLFIDKVKFINSLRNKALRMILQLLSMGAVIYLVLAFKDSAMILGN